MFSYLLPMPDESVLDFELLTIDSVLELALKLK